MAGFWESCLLRFEQELPAQQFNTWIKPLRLEGESVPLDGLRLIAPNSFILKWVRDRYLTRIEEYAGAFFAGPISIALIIGSAKPAPATNRDTSTVPQSATHHASSSAEQPRTAQRAILTRSRGFFHHSLSTI
jgi:chromosomal replication initiator protein